LGYGFIGIDETVKVGMKRRFDLNPMWNFFEDAEKKFKYAISHDKRIVGFNSFP